MSKTNVALVEHCKKALNERWGYVYGTFGTVLTEKLLQDKLRQYPSNVKQYESFIRSNWMGKTVVDCVGLIKSYLWWNGTQAVYNPATDISADTMYEIAKERGAINTIPEIPGLCVWHKGHIGVYIGNGEVIESRGTMYGVVKTKLKDRPWTHWLKCPFIEYVGVEDKLRDLKEALKILNTKKIGNDVVVNTPEYWLNAIEKGKVNAEYVKALIIKFAKYVNNAAEKIILIELFILCILFPISLSLEFSISKICIWLFASMISIHIVNMMG